MRFKYRRKEGLSPLIAILAVAAAVILMLELAAPRIIESRLEDVIASNVDAVDYVRVRLRTFPAVNVISSGRVNNMSIDCRGISVDGLRVDSLSVEARAILLDLHALAEERRVVLSQVEEGRVTISLTEDDLNLYIHKLEDVPSSVRIQLESGMAVVSGYVNVAGIDIGVNVSGTFVVKDGTRLGYVINQIQVGNAILPSVISNGLLGVFDFSLDMSGLPVSLVISDITIEDRIVRIIGRTLSDTEESG